MDDADADKIMHLITLIQEEKKKIPPETARRVEKTKERAFARYIKDLNKDVITKNFLLHLAVEHGKLSYIKKLLDKGIDVNSVDEIDRTPLDLSSTKTARTGKTGEREEIVNMLLDAGGIFSRIPYSEVIEIWKKWYIHQQGSEEQVTILMKKLLLVKISENFNIPPQCSSIINEFLDTDDSLRASLEAAFYMAHKEVLPRAIKQGMGGVNKMQLLLAKFEKSGTEE
jgi:ankyrin repeat protein